MRFIVSTKGLLIALQAIQGALNVKSVIPITECFLFEIKDGILTLSSTGIEATMQTKIEVDGKENFQVAIPGKILLDLLKSLPDQPLHFKVSKKAVNTQADLFWVDITSDSGKYKITCEDARDFPKIPKPQKAADINISYPHLMKCLDRVCFAASTEKIFSSAFHGVLITSGADGTTCVATNRHILASIIRSDARSAQESKMLVPASCLSLLKLLPGNRDFSLSYDKSNAFFAIGDTLLIHRLVDGTFPAYDEFIPQNNPNKLSVNRLEFLGIIKRLFVFVDPLLPIVVLSISGCELKINSQNIDYCNEADERMPCNYEGVDMEIGFSARQLISVVEHMYSDEISFEMSTHDKITLLKPVDQIEHEDSFTLLMPVSIGKG